MKGKQIVIIKKNKKTMITKKEPSNISKEKKIPFSVAPIPTALEGVRFRRLNQSRVITYSAKSFYTMPFSVRIGKSRSSIRPTATSKSMRLNDTHAELSIRSRKRLRERE